MEQCSRQCIRRTLYAVMIGVSPIVICLIFLALARLILSRLEIFYYRRKKKPNRRPSILSYKKGRLALSYTPVSNAELQRVIQGEYHSRQPKESSMVYKNSIHNSSIRRAPKFIKSILPRREPASSTLSPSILANLVLRRDVIDTIPITGLLTPLAVPLQPIFSYVNEQDQRRRPSVITVRRQSVETTTLAAMNNNNNENSLNSNDSPESEHMMNDPLMTTTKTMTTTTVVVEEILEYHSVSSLPCALTVLTSVSENDNETNSETDNENEAEEE